MDKLNIDTTNDRAHHINIAQGGNPFNPLQAKALPFLQAFSFTFPYIYL